MQGGQAEGPPPDLFQSGLVWWGRALVAAAAAVPAGVLLLVEKRRVNILEGFMQ